MVITFPNPPAVKHFQIHQCNLYDVKYNLKPQIKLPGSDICRYIMVEKDLRDEKFQANISTVMYHITLTRHIGSTFQG